MGHTWLPLLKDGRVFTGDVLLPVAVSLPPGYLSMQDQIGKVSADCVHLTFCCSFALVIF